MRRRYRNFLRIISRILPAVTAASIGLFTVWGLFTDSDWQAASTAILLQIIAVVAALAVVIGVWNLMRVHAQRVGRYQKGWFYSLIVLVSAAAVIVVGVVDPRTNDGSDKQVSFVVFDAIQVSLESALAGLIFFFLVYAAYRMLHQRVTWNGILFTAALLLVLIGWLPLQGLDVIKNLRGWLLEIPVTAGSRGLLIGIAMATVITSLRVLIGQERAYREE